jgi:hypothetical protein
MIGTGNLLKDGILFKPLTLPATSSNTNASVEKIIQNTKYIEVPSHLKIVFLTLMPCPAACHTEQFP